MEVITTHTYADFDTLASMVAAKKLYPDAVLAFPGSLEKKLKDAIARLSLPYRIEKPNRLDLGKVERLILVDVRDSRRIGRFSEIAGSVDVHIYDHHPPAEGDLHGSLEVVRMWGSTTTVITHIIKERGIGLTPAEATVLMAGIYEDTGTLTYPGTTREDFEAAGFLLSFGADLRTVTELLKKELTPEEVSLLDEMLKGETRYTLDGVEVLIAEVYVPLKYKGDLATLAHRVMDIEGMGCLFLLVDSGDRVHIIARSALPEVNAGSILRDLGGGGHPGAASATLKGVTLVQAREGLLEAVKKRVLPRRTARDIMSSPAITVGPDAEVEEADSVMRKYGINASPVARDGDVQGVITRDVLGKALHHGLGRSPVKDFMSTHVVTVEESAGIEEIREKVTDGERIMPVLKNGRVTGVITRTDLLKLLQEELRERPARGVRRVKVVKSLMKERLPEWVFTILREAGEAADSLGMRAYVVGGFVRDLLLRRENLDIDIVIEGGDGIVFAKRYAKKKGLKVRPHERFKTAVLVFPDGFKIDVATARLEFYERPGALPTIEQSSLKLDLYRRDFIINTIAAQLNPEKFGVLIDFFGAQRDMKEKKIRVLHNLSFIEDPTRVLRAVRFSEKFGFSIDNHTLYLLKNAVRLDVFKTISGARLLEELKSILEEETVVEAMRRLHELGILGLIDERLVWDPKREGFMERAREALSWYRLLYTGERVEAWLPLFLALTDTLSEKELEAVTRRLSIVGKKERGAIGARKVGLKALSRVNLGVRKRSELYRLLKPLPIEVVLYLMAKAEKEEARKALSTHITKLKDVRTSLKGKDLVRMGFPPGPVIGEILEKLLEKRLDGDVASREDEVEFVRERHGTLRPRGKRRSA